MKYTSILILPLLGLSLSSCGGIIDESNSNGLAPHVLVESGFQVLHENEATGNGALRLMEILPQHGGRSVILKGSLNQNLNSSISLVMYSPNASVPNSSGVTVRFVRSGAKVQATVAINGNQVPVTSPRLDYYFPASLDLIVEVHNTGTRARVLIWRRDFTVYSAATADIDSERSGDLSSVLPYQTGGGGYMGVRLNQATINTLQVQLPKVLPQ